MHFRSFITKIQRYSSKVTLLILFCCFCSAAVRATTLPRDSFRRHTIKLDLAPLYSVLFDVRKQIRLGLEYQKNTDKRYFTSIHLDAGLFDDYTYYKYYDFFNQNGGLYHIRQDVKTYGFHLMPSWHYKLSRMNPKKRMRAFTGITADLNCFEKQTKSYNSRSQENSKDIVVQGRFGLGAHLGLSYRVVPRFHLELKGVIIGKVISVSSGSNENQIKPFKAVWFDEDQYIWVIPQLNICYDF